uniref:SDR family NAD(P)-dependent oxidoreductase n=1 Tax=Roseihalotalea indica TaxID=2867963 RepID=A0AA49GM74_9BACT|nr:SDR family NAD(P)-dependent oxidoreductase [Tunicatimonas sp. TK19036]
MKSKNCLVTGAAGNLGKAVVTQLISDGHTVVGVMKPSHDAGKLQEFSEFTRYEADVSQENEVENLIKHLTQTHQHIDFAALLVGGFAMGPLESTSLEDIRKMYELNFITAYLCCQKLYTQMIQQENGGDIVLVGARPALEPSAAATMVSYSLSKSLLFQLSDIINAKTSKTGVRCSVIVPSIIDTPNNRESMPDANFDDWVTPDQIAKTISYLASPTSKPLRQTIFKLYGDA